MSKGRARFFRSTALASAKTPLLRTADGESPVASHTRTSAWSVSSSKRTLRRAMCHTSVSHAEPSTTVRLRAALGQPRVNQPERVRRAVAVHEDGVGDGGGAEPGVAEDVGVALQIGDGGAHEGLLRGGGRAAVAGKLREPDRFAELFEPFQAAALFQVILQRGQVAVVPMHGDVIDLAAGAGGEEVFQILVGIGAVAAGRRATEVHGRRDD